MQTNWITLVSSLAFTMEMKIRFATKKEKKENKYDYYIWKLISSENYFFFKLSASCISQFIP